MATFIPDIAGDPEAFSEEYEEWAAGVDATIPLEEPDFDEAAWEEIGQEQDARDDAEAAEEAEEWEWEPDDCPLDGDAESALASCGMGTDEDYGYFGGDDGW